MFLRVHEFFVFKIGLSNFYIWYRVHGSSALSISERPSLFSVVTGRKLKKTLIFQFLALDFFSRFIDTDAVKT